MRRFDTIRLMAGVALATAAEASAACEAAQADSVPLDARDAVSDDEARVPRAGSDPIRFAIEGGTDDS